MGVKRDPSLSPFGNIEAYLRDSVYAKSLPLLLRRSGVDVEVYRNISTPTPDKWVEAPRDVEDITRGVYGILNDLSPSSSNEAGAANQIISCRMLIAAALYADSDSTFASDFEQKYVITDTKLLSGDTFYIVRKDGVRKGWHIVAQQTVGTTTDVFKRYDVSSVSE